MVRIRLARYGRKRRPFYRIVVLDSRRAREGKALANLGFFDPIHDDITINQDAYQKYINQGAQPSDRVAQIYKRWIHKTEER